MNKQSLLKWLKIGMGTLTGLILIPIVLTKVSPGFAAKVNREKMDNASSVSANIQVGEDAFVNSDVDLCEAYHWIGEMEHQTRQYSERKQPGLSAIEREAQLSKERDRRWIDYANRHKIPDSMRVQINVAGMNACK
jgi:hypothetical protein